MAARRAKSSLQKKAEQASQLTPADELATILAAHSDKRVLVIGTTCCGKTALRSQIGLGIDLDDIVLPTFRPSELKTLDSDSWSPKVFERIQSRAKNLEEATPRPGCPAFGTVLVDADLVVRLRISDDLLRQRANMRGVSEVKAKAMDVQIDEQLKSVVVPVIDLDLG
jgi:hypothetical protein